MNRNNYNYNHSIKLSQSQMDMMNISENNYDNYDDVVLPTIQKKINSNLSTINLINNSSNSFENINSNNSIGNIESFKDKNEKFNLKDLPPPENITEETKNKFKCLSYLVDNIFERKLFFNKFKNHKEISLENLEKDLCKKIYEKTKDDEIKSILENKFI